MSVRPEILALLKKSSGGDGLVGGGLVGGGLVGGAVIGGDGMKAGKLPKDLRRALGKVNPEYKKRRKEARSRYKAAIEGGKLPSPPAANSAKAKARGQAAAATRKENTKIAKQMTVEMMTPKMTPQQVAILYKANKEAAQKAHRKEKRLEAKAKKAASGAGMKSKVETMYANDDDSESD
jgi:hypothetical protein